MSELVVLHISDLHFGIENDKSASTKFVRLRQREMLSSLIKTIKELVSDAPDWKPNVIAVSGDVSWSGEAEEYRLYKTEFAEPLAAALNIESDHIITCPGNHDIMRGKADGLSRHVVEKKNPDVKELTLAEAEKQAGNFEGYVSELCGGNPDNLCRLITYEEWPWVSFLSLNSAWDCRDNQDEGRLRVGLPLLENLIEKVPAENYVVTLFHHPHTEIEDYIEEIDYSNHVTTLKKRKWLHISETEPEHDGEQCFASYVEQKSTFILNGHIHKETEPKKLRQSIQLISGTLYSQDTPRYHCRLLKLSDQAEPTYCDMRRAINADTEQWEVTRPKKFQFEHIAILLSKKKEQEKVTEQFRRFLQEATEQYERDKDSEELLKAVHEAISALSHEAAVSSDILEGDKTFVNEKVSDISQTDVLTLRNEGDN